MKKLVFAILLLGQASFASTFVGNGGSAGEVELTVTLRQIEQTAEAAPDHANPYCTCSEDFSGSDFCDQLKEMSNAQASLCQSEFPLKAADLKKLLSGDHKLSFKWTHDTIEVREKSGLTAADAVANPERNEVIINQERFLQLRSYERIFLLTHELMHFTNYKGKRLTDEGAVGAFDGADGGRRFINAIAASTVMQAADDGLLDRYVGTLNRSKAWKKNWIDLDIGHTSWVTDPGQTYQINSYSNFHLGYRHYFGNFAVIGSYRAQGGSGTFLSSIQETEHVNALGVGVGYRVFLFKDPLTYFGQSYLEGHALVERLNTTYNLSDPYNSINDTASSTGGSFGVSYEIPVAYGFFAYGSLDYAIRSYQYSTINLKYSNDQFTTSVGVSYAF